MTPREPTKGLQPVSVMVGRKVEITASESRQIAALADTMHSLAREQRKGWFGPFVQTQTALNRLIHRVVQRSHAS